MFSYIILYKTDKLQGGASFGPGGHDLSNLGKGPYGKATCQIRNIWADWFQGRRFVNVFLYKSM